MKILCAVLKLPAEKALPIQPIYLKIGLNWQYCVAGSSKMAPRIFIFLMAMGKAEYSFELISIETYAPQFIGYYELFLDSVRQNMS